VSTSTDDGSQRSDAGPDEETVARASLSSPARGGAMPVHGQSNGQSNGQPNGSSGSSISSQLSGAFHSGGAPEPQRPSQAPRSPLSAAMSGIGASSPTGAAAASTAAPTAAAAAAATANSAAGGATQQMPPVPARPAYPTVPVSSAPVHVPQPDSRSPQPQYAPSAPVQPQAQPRQAAAPVQRASGPRKVRLNIAMVDPFSVLKLSFLVSVGIGIATVVASIVVWNVLNGMGVFSEVNRLAVQIAGENSGFDVNNYVGLGRVVSLATVIAVINVALLTALSTLGAFLYNLSSGLVGGLHVTLSDD
jgi:hypothetical protein